jgi:recombination protein RecT
MENQPASSKPTAIVKKSELAQLLESRREALSQVLPKHITPDRMVKVALLCVNENPALKRCTPASVFQAVLQSAETGLELGSAMGHAYLVPYGQDAKFIPGYRGLLDLVRRSGTVKDIQLELVYTKDLFEREGGFEPKFRHVPVDGDRGEIRGAYCVMRFKDGGTQATWMTKKEIDAIRDVVLAKQRGRSDSPWSAHYGQMALKTVVRRACKIAPVSREVAMAVAADEEADQHGYHAGAMESLDFSTPEEPAAKIDEKTGIVEGSVVPEDAPVVASEPPPTSPAPAKPNGKVKITDIPGDTSVPQVSAALKKALDSIAKARSEHDSKRLADTAVFVKEALKGEEHTQALAAYKQAKAEVDEREPGSEG